MAAARTADAAAEAAVAAAPPAAPPAAESDVEAAVRQHGTTLAEAPAAGGGKTARRPVSTPLSPFGMGTPARTGKENKSSLTLDRQ